MNGGLHETRNEGTNAVISAAAVGVVCDGLLVIRYAAKLRTQAPVIDSKIVAPTLGQLAIFRPFFACLRLFGIERTAQGCARR